MRLGRRVPRSFFGRPADEVAPDLLGRVLVHRSAGGRVAVRLSEVEAYSGQGTDPASHAHRGPTARNAVMFGPPGHLYVYFVYGMHWCVNVVCGPEGEASAVLLRAGEVVVGEALARERRPTARFVAELARGPARLAQALALDGTHDGLDLCEPGATVSMHRGEPVHRSSHGTGPRVGVTAAQETPWRWFVPGDPTVSAWRPGGRSRGVRPAVRPTSTR